jgi:hypothetical protein
MRYPLSIFALFNTKTLDYRFESQAFVGIRGPLSINAYFPKTQAIAPPIIPTVTPAAAISAKIGANPLKK